jgi:hypothetical protein
MPAVACAPDDTAGFATLMRDDGDVPWHSLLPVTAAMLDGGAPKLRLIQKWSEYIPNLFFTAPAG